MEIYTSKVITFMLSIPMLILSAILFLVSALGDNLIKFVSIGVGLFLLALCFNMFYRRFRGSNPFLFIGEHGVIAPNYCKVPIEWRDVTRIQSFETKRYSKFVVFVVHPASIDKYTSFKRTMPYGSQNSKNHLPISLGWVEGSFEENIGHITNAWNKSRGLPLTKHSI